MVTDIPSGIPELVRNGETGYRIPVGDVAGFAERPHQFGFERAEDGEAIEPDLQALRIRGRGAEDFGTRGEA